MDGAAFLLLATGVGVGFGWQPMPDGSPRYEYVVQVDPDLAATLADGQSIPIVGEIPEEIQPIGRVRLVVGRGDLPRQRLVTLLKPTDEAAAANPSGVVAAQFSQAADPRYAAPPQLSSPPVAQQATQAVQSVATQWNSGEASLADAPAAAPSGTDLFNSATEGVGQAWNDNIAAPAAGALSSVGQNLQEQVVAPVKQQLNAASGQLQQSFGAVDDRVRGAANQLGGKTQDLVNQLTQPVGAQPFSPQAVAAPSNTPHGWNQEPPPGNPLRADVPAPQATAGQQNWNGESAIGNAAGANPWNTAPPAAATPSNLATAQTADDQWRGVPDPRTAADPHGSDPHGAALDASHVAVRPETPFGGMGSQFPGAVTPATPTMAFGNSPTLSPPNAAAPSISSDMLTKSPARPFDELAASGQLSAAPVSTNQPAAQAPPARDISATAPAPTAASNAPPATPPLASSAAALSNDSGGTAKVLAAFVLLCGSIAGNLYLFWSYLDVRQKYRALVRKTARAVGSRFSAA